MPADQRYRPSNMTRRIEFPYKREVLRADPDFEQQKRNETFYEFSNGRVFKGNPANSGAYAED